MTADVNRDQYLPVEPATIVPNSWDTIVVPLDGSESAEQALPLAKSLARAFRARLELVHVLADSAMLDLLSGLAIPDRHAAETYLRGVADRGGEDIIVGIETMRGNPADELTQLTDDNPNTIVVMSTHGRGGLGRVMFGSVADKVMRAAAAPVVLTRSKMSGVEPRLKTMLVPLDGSSLAEAALPLAVDLARDTDATISLVRVVEPFWTTARVADVPEATYLSPSQIAEVDQRGIMDARGYLDDVANDLRAKDVRVVWEVRVGRTPDEIVRVAETAAVDLIVMATHGLGGIRRWALGSVTNEVLHRCATPILIIPPKARTQVREKTGEMARVIS